MTTRLGGWKNNLETKGTFEATNQWGIVLTPNVFATHITSPGCSPQLRSTSQPIVPMAPDVSSMCLQALVEAVFCLQAQVSG
jgi:hypothetical protein